MPSFRTVAIRLWREDVASYIDPLAGAEPMALIMAVLIQESDSYVVEDEDGRMAFRRRKFVATRESTKRLKLA